MGLRGSSVFQYTVLDYSVFHFYSFFIVVIATSLIVRINHPSQSIVPHSWIWIHWQEKSKVTGSSPNFPCNGTVVFPVDGYLLWELKPLRQ